jgi:hypothetical protein
MVRALKSAKALALNVAVALNFCDGFAMANPKRTEQRREARRPKTDCAAQHAGA